MSDDMSMFRKMKERITDEVSSASSKLQNMQIIDQLTSSVGQQINDLTPNQILPEPYVSSTNSTNQIPVTSQYSLIDDRSVGGLNEEEELNSESSPQHQLFNEHSIMRLEHSNSTNLTRHNNGSLPEKKFSTDTYHSEDLDNPSTVINIDQINSDIEDGANETDSNECTKEGDGYDVEIDLLSDRPVPSNIFTTEQMIRFKSKYKGVVHAIRKLNRDSLLEKAKLESENNELVAQIVALKAEVDNSKQHDSLLSVSTNISDKDDKSSFGSPQPPTKSGQKLRDLERLLAKCKESLKLKNSQIKALKDSLSEIEKFKESNQELRRELADLREAHETWTVSIAENKRVMHQELENKNAEMETLKGETNDLKLKLTDSHNKTRQLKSAIQDLESRLVSTSAAHQKERESLKKELTMVKNNAIRQIQKEHEHNIERIKLDMEKSIEALKLEVLNKDEQIIRDATRLQQLHDDNYMLNKELTQAREKLQVNLGLTDQSNETHLKEIEQMKTELDSYKDQIVKATDLEELNKQLSTEFESLKRKISEMEDINSKLEEQLNDINSSSRINDTCQRCIELDSKLKGEVENYQQQLHEINARLSFLTTANEDQEKEIQLKNSEIKLLIDNNKALKFEFDEMSKKNESLTQVLTENEVELRAQQDQCNNLTVLEKDLGLLKKENATLLESIDQLKSEVGEKSSMLAKSESLAAELKTQVANFKTDLHKTQKTVEELRREKELFTSQNSRLDREREELKEQLVVKILSTMKNLETPTTSPGSDKSYTSTHQGSDHESNQKTLPDPLILMEDLSSLAIDKSQAHLTSNQRLQAVLLENTMLTEHLQKLKDEMNNLNREKAEENQCSIEETEKLLLENQALIHDQQSYDERIRTLEDEIRVLSTTLAERDVEMKQASEITKVALERELELVLQTKELEMSELKKIIDEKDNSEKPQLSNLDVPDSTEFEYLKNIVYQFMLGREPLVLARVISAVLKFDKSQIDHICRKQEAMQAALKPSI